ncbi:MULTISPECIES: ankyrin repeat domain-containing protein [unclassified Rhodococcus (in: high G+C Gram-positive bacteria)]|uniref:ankyrin repeat domain-containing protein n=1 Tax=unclassified Rhodococcus (in: high G+C Gram-positive bacteria) TaxID=192944 RepID=UPI0005E5CAF3|nr:MULTISPECIES: ankyrin repeat domain-containing protein [unclassified Rhodococcus (in: high G+C Gram-positive bacteria)]KJF24540.1 Ankyrin repeats (3 copies) [Rhodococcus sp. AD45]
MNRKSGIVLAAGVVLAVAGCGSAASPATSPSASVASVEASKSSEPSVAPAQSTPESERALIAATKSNDVEAATALILAGADVNAKDSIQDSAFLYAGAEGLNQILALTLSHGADVHSVNTNNGCCVEQRRLTRMSTDRTVSFFGCVGDCCSTLLVPSSG